MKKLNDLFYSFLPTVLISILNIMLWLELKRFHAKSVKITLQVNTMKNKLENHRTAKTQLILALFFLIVSVPRSISTALFIIYRSDVSYFSLKIFSLLSLIYLNSTLITLLVQNIAFKKQFYSLVFSSSRSRDNSRDSS